MFSSARSIIATLIVSTIVVGTPPLAGSESWSDFFRDLFSIADYESIIENECKLTEQLNRKDQLILGRLASKNLIIERLSERKISFFQAAACFHFIQKESNDLIELSDRNFKHLPKETQSAINLLQWTRPNLNLIESQKENYEQFKFEVEKAECGGIAIDLPQPPPDLLANLMN